MESAILVVFGLVYLGMLLGGIPGLALDRTGVALIGAIAIVALGRTPLADVWAAVDMPTLYLLFGMMVISAQFRLAGFYTHVTRRIVDSRVSETALLGLVVGLSGLLSAILTNDIVCLAMAPLLIETCAKKRLDPLPFLLALACASNIGSAATLIGNPQNILIGARLGLSFRGFLLDAGVPALIGLVSTWAIIARQFRGKWRRELVLPEVQAPALDRWQAVKGGAVTLAVLAAFSLAPSVPREAVALLAAGVLLLSRRMSSREMLALIDWHLLVLFIGLFIVNAGMQATGAMDAALGALARRGVDVAHPAALFGLSALLSNLVSNVPATMLLLPSAAHPHAGAILALSSTLAGNLLIVGSIANIIVVTQARALGLEIDVRTHARTGVPVTLVTLSIAALWLVLRSP